MDEWGGMVVTNEIHLRNEVGQFIKRLETGAEAAARDLAENIAALGRVFVPKRTGRLMRSIKSFMVGPYTGVALAGEGVPYAAAQEEGARAHIIPSLLRGGATFLYNSEELFAAMGPVEHPGNPATRFMGRAYAHVGALSEQIVMEHMPD